MMEKVNNETAPACEFNAETSAEAAQQQQVVVISGASSGIGKLAALTLAGAGYKVVATMRATEGRNAGAAKAKYGF